MLLFVTTDPAAEQRIAEEAYRAWFIRGLEPLMVLVTTTDRIDTDREGVLGRVWRRLPVMASLLHVDLEYWPPGDALYRSCHVSGSIDTASRARTGRQEASPTAPPPSQVLYPDWNGSVAHDQAGPSGPSAFPQITVARFEEKGSSVQSNGHGQTGQTDESSSRVFLNASEVGEQLGLRKSRVYELAAQACCQTSGWDDGSGSQSVGWLHSPTLPFRNHVIESSQRTVMNYARIDVGMPLEEARHRWQC
jgi:hypothetical protein